MFETITDDIPTGPQRDEEISPTQFVTCNSQCRSTTTLYVRGVNYVKMPKNCRISHAEVAQSMQKKSHFE
jgi:hypothetical protein